MSNVRSCKFQENSKRHISLSTSTRSSRSHHPLVRTYGSKFSPQSAANVRLSSYLCLEDMGYLESEEINPCHVYLCYNREPSTQPASHCFTLCIGWHHSLGYNHRKGYIK